MTELTFQEHVNKELEEIREWEDGKINNLRLGIGVKLSSERTVIVKLENSKMLVEFYTTDTDKLTNTITLTQQPAIYMSTYEEAERDYEGGDKLILRITGTSNKFLKRGKAYKRDIEFIPDQYMETALEAMKKKAKEIGLKEDLTDERSLKKYYADGKYLYRDSQPVSELVMVPAEGGSKRKTRRNHRKHKKQTHKKRSKKHRTRKHNGKGGKKSAKKSRKHRRRH